MKQSLMLCIAGILLISSPLAFAHDNCHETPSADVMINEVSFKDKEKDWVEIFARSNADLSGFTLSDDRTFYTFPEGSLLQEGVYLIIYSADGFTGTTEQIALRDPYGNIVSSACWKSATPTEDELKDFSELHIDPSACIASEQVSVGASIGYTENGFSIFPHPTPGQKNEIINAPPVGIMTIQEGETSAFAPLKINVTGEDSYDVDSDLLTFMWNFGDGETYAGANPPSHTYAIPGTYTMTLTVNDAFNAAHQASLTVNALPHLPAADTAPLLTSPDETPPPPQNISPPPPPESLPPEDLINEFMPNPEGNDMENEWIELFNPSENEVDLNSFLLDDSEGGSKPYMMTEKIPAKSFLVLSAKTTGLALNNDTDSVRLLDSNGTILEKISYTDVKENSSYAKTADGSWQWTKSFTPAAENTVTEIITKKKSGKKLVAEIAKAAFTPPKKKKAKKLKSSKVTYANGDLSDEIIISEIFPNPKGSDRNLEWIELFNASDDPVNLANWLLDDAEGGSKPYRIPPITLQPNAFLLIPSKESHLALNNENDSVRIFDFDGNLKDEISYDDTQEGDAYARAIIDHETRFFWSEPTPGKENPSFALVQGILVAATEEFFTIENEHNETHEVQFDSETFPREFRESLPIDRKIRVVVARTPEKTEKLVSVDYVEPPNLKTSALSLWKTIMNIATGIAVFTGGVFFVSRKLLT